MDYKSRQAMERGIVEPEARRGARWDSESGFLRGSGLRLPAGRGAGQGPGGGAPGLWGRGRPALFSPFSVPALAPPPSPAPLSLLPSVLPILSALSVRLAPLRPLGCWALPLLLRCPTRRALSRQQPRRPGGMRGWRLCCRRTVRGHSAWKRVAVLTPAAAWGNLVDLCSVKSARGRRTNTVIPLL